MPTRPGGERCVALLGTGTTIAAVVEIEDGLMDHSATHIITVAALPEIDIVPGRGFGVLQRAMKQIDLRVLFPHQAMAQLMSHH